MKSTMVWKGLSCLPVLSLLCCLLAGCGEGQGGAADPADCHIDGSAEQGSAAAGSEGTPGSSAERSGNPANSAMGRQVLTAVVTAPFRAPMDQIRKFNEGSPSYFIEVKSYGEGLDVQAAANLETRLSLEILSGEGPDLVIWDRALYTPALASDKLMENLYDFMDADPDFHREDYYENILEAFEKNGGLYVLPTSFAVKTGCVRADELEAGRGVTEGWEFREMMEAYENSPHAERFAENFTQELQLRFLCEDCMGNFIDWSSGECYFDTPEFVELLEFCHSFPRELTLPENYNGLEYRRSGKIFWDTIELNEPWGVAYKRAEFGSGNLLWPGHPVADGEKELGGGVAVPFQASFSICRNSGNGEAAWECVKSWLGEDMQRRTQGIPLMRSVSEARIREALTVEYETVEGEQQEKSKYEMQICISDFETETLKFSCITEEDAELYRSMIENTHRSTGRDAVVLDIILEEAGALFEGSKDAETVADIIQNRVRIYVSERMI